MPRQQTPRFGIGEWYGRSFVRLSPDERRQFAELALTHTTRNAPPCPFLSTTMPVQCSKKGGICSLRRYEHIDNGSAVAASGDEGSLRVVCPHRFKQSGIIYSTIGQIMLGTTAPQIVAEVRFLRRGIESTVAETVAAP